MRRNYISLLCLLTTCILTICLQTTTAKAEAIIDKTSNVDIAQLYEHKDNTELILSYVLENKKQITLKTSEAKMIDFKALQEELGESKVKIDDDQKTVQLTLDDPNRLDFKLFVDNKSPFTLSVFDADNKNIFDYACNKPETFDDSLDADPLNPDEIGWIETDKLHLSAGPIFEHSDGTSTQPYLYFGDYISAKINKPIETAYAPKGRSREVSLTAANSAVLYAEVGSRIQDGLANPNNHIYTSHYGDNQGSETDLFHLPEEDKPFGSPNNYISTNLFNYVKQTDRWLRPGTAGPDKNGYSYAMTGKPKLYYRKNPQTNFEEQRLVYNQRATWNHQGSKENPEITTTVKQSFDEAGRVITNITFKNTGTNVFNNFSGFSSQDFSLNKDGKEIRDNKNKKIGNNIPMRSLGNKRGMYIQSLNNEFRASVYTNLPNRPHAWAARSVSKSYLATKGFMYDPGVLGLIAASSERYYPWKSGKDDRTIFGPTKFFDGKNNTFYSPYVPKNLYNAFYDQHDPGDTDSKVSAGTRLAVSEKSPLWDSGLTMRTYPIDLQANDSVKMEYATKLDVRGKTFNPVISMDHHGTLDDPEILTMDINELPISGSWYDFDSKNVTLYYSIDSEESEDYHPLVVDKQTVGQAQYGTHHEIKAKLNLKGLDKSKHKIRFIMVDEDGNYSNMEEHVIKFVTPATVEPQIHITSPGATPKEPHNPFEHDIDIRGFWSDKDSDKIKSISYSIDGNDEKQIHSDLDNKDLGKMNPLKIDDLDIKEHNDLKKHVIKFKIVDSSGNVGIDKFHFRHAPGTIQLTAPEEIDFGSISVSPTGISPIKPNLKGDKVTLDDYREEHSTPVGVSLSIEPFTKAKEDEDEHNVDGDGDDSGLSGDPDDSRSAKNTLRHSVYWNDQITDTKNLIIGQTEAPKNNQWQQSTDFTDEIEKNLKINFNSGESGAALGKYVSKWNWQIVDSVQ